MALLGLSLCLGFTACGDDDDNDSSGSGVMKLNGKDYALTYGFYDTAQDDCVSFEFSNFNLANPSGSIPKKIDMLYFNIEGITSLEPGTYNVVIEFSSSSTSDEEVSYPGAAGSVSLTLEKDGSNYKITIPETTVSYYPSGDEAESIEASFSFSWTGQLKYCEPD